jgi:hypothetical protein
MTQSLTPQDQQGLQALHTPVNTSGDPSWVDLNEVVQDLMERMKHGPVQSRAIIRYETLPVVSGNPEKLSELFGILFHSIVMQGGIGTKPFIYIRCTLQQSEIMDLSVPANSGMYSLTVYTNIVANHVWLEQHRADIETMKSILKNLHGNLHCSTIENTGCLYLITLPGKLL